MSNRQLPLVSFFLITAFFLSAVNTSFAEGRTWNGASSTTSNWSDGANWVEGTPPPGTDTDVVFDGFTRLNNIIDAPTEVSSLTFNYSAQSFNIGGAALTIDNGITNISPNDQTISAPLVLTQGQTWGTFFGNLIVKGQITGSSMYLYKYGYGNLTLGGTQANTHMGLFYVDGGGTAFLEKPDGVDAISSDLNIVDGVVKLNANEQINDSADVDISGATGRLDLNDHNETIRTLQEQGTVTLGSGTLSIIGNSDSYYQGVISGTGNLTKAGSGTLTLTGINTYTGTTTVNGGTLAINDNDRISNLSNLIMGGGTFSSGGFNQTMGILTLNADSTINMGGHGVMTFADSSGATWAANKTLTIANWSGSLNGGGSTQFMVGASGLNSSQLKEIKFFNPAGLTAGLYDAKLLSSGEVVPVPEPATLALGGLLMGLVAKRARKKKI